MDSDSENEGKCSGCDGILEKDEILCKKCKEKQKKLGIVDSDEEENVEKEVNQKEVEEDEEDEDEESEEDDEEESDDEEVEESDDEDEENTIVVEKKEITFSYDVKPIFVPFPNLNNENKDNSARKTKPQNIPKTPYYKKR